MRELGRRLMDRLPAWARPGVELLQRTVREVIDDRVPGLAAEIAFYLVLSLPPLLLTVLGSLGYVGELFGTAVGEELRRHLMQGSRTIFTEQTVREVVEPMLGTLLEQGRADVASFGILLSLWSASRALNVVLEAIVIAYDLEHRKRRGWRRRAYALGLTLAGVALGLVIAPLLVAGPKLGVALAEPLGLASTFGMVWQVLYWPLVTVIATSLLCFLYHYGVPWQTPWHRDLPGAILAMAVWLGGSFALRHYARLVIESQHAVYSRISAPIVILLWLWVCGFAILLGAELNAEIERMWPRRKSALPPPG